MSKPVFDGQAFKKLIDANAAQVIAHVMGDVVELALQMKYGNGIIRRAQVSEKDVEAIYAAFAPLQYSLLYEASASHMRMMNGMLREPTLRNYFLRTTAGIIGKSGGRAPRARAKHLVWLESKMRRIEEEHRDDVPSLTAKGHFKELQLRHEIDKPDQDGALTFQTRYADKFEINGNDPVITLKMVSTMLTKIRKGGI